MASGDSLIILRAQDNEPPATNYALLDTRNQHPILAFDDTSNWDGVFTAIMPQHYAGGGVDLYIHWAHVAAAGNVDWDSAFERIGDQVQDIDADGFAAVQSADNQTVPANAGDVDISTIAFTDGAQMDGLLVGESFRIKLTRDAASDTAVGNAQVLTLEMRET